MAEKPLV